MKKRNFAPDPLSDHLIAEGWLTPNTYSNHYGMIPEASGVYLFYFTNDMFDIEQSYRVIYVGKSINLAARHSGHEVRALIERQASKFSHLMCWFKTMPIEAITQAEIDLIKKYDPAFNLVHRVKRL